VKSGFDEVIVVDGSYDARVRAATEALCREHGATYVPAPRSVRDRRSLQRNLGARAATAAWLLFQDDDDDVPLRIRREVLEADAAGRDWLVGPGGEHIVLHRREAFLAFGGYPEDMVAGEDMTMSNRARRRGRGGLHGNWAGLTVFPSLPTEDPISRVRNAFWYGFTMTLYLFRTAHRHHVLVGDARRVAKFAREVLRGRARGAFYLLFGLLGRALSPFQAFAVAARQGGRGLAQEPHADWQGLRGKG
jgi:hypothetical protein